MTKTHAEIAKRIAHDITLQVTDTKFDDLKHCLNYSLEVDGMASEAEALMISIIEPFITAVAEKTVIPTP